jgi:cephalosporin hydroxylase
MSKIKIDDKNFYDMPKWEQHELFSTTHLKFFGLTLQQTPLAVLKLNQLLNYGNFERIIEIGAGDGGLSFLFALWAKINKKEYHTYDIHDKGANIELLKSFTTAFQVKDVIFDKDNVEGIKSLIEQQGRVLLIADAGKHVEFNVYADSLKAGDFIMTHDFSPTKETFESEIKGKIWNWHESWYSAIEDACIRNNIVHTTYFYDCVWSLGICERGK